MPMLIFCFFIFEEFFDDAVNLLRALEKKASFGLASESAYSRLASEATRFRT